MLQKKSTCVTDFIFMTDNLQPLLSAGIRHPQIFIVTHVGVLTLIRSLKCGGYDGLVRAKRAGLVKTVNYRLQTFQQLGLNIKFNTTVDIHLLF
jgi:hypothetical protein